MFALVCRSILLRAAHGFVVASLGLFALTSIAQTATESIAIRNELPLRNLLIEVRQVQQDKQQVSQAQASGNVLVAPDDLRFQGQAHLRAGSSERSHSAAQQVLVLNGQAARISLGRTLPLRLRQTIVRNGVRVNTEGTVFLEANSGFMATPRWDGSGFVQLELSAQQSQPISGSRQAGTPVVTYGAGGNAAMSSVVVLPLDMWTTVAQSEQLDGGTESNWGGSSAQSNQTTTQVQVRLTVR